MGVFGIGCVDSANEAHYLAIDNFTESAYNEYMIETPPRLSTMRTMAGSFF